MNLNEQIAHWLTSNTQSFNTTGTVSAQRPWITLCYAQSWDGSITTRAGTSLALSGAASTCLTHQLRSMHQGILVGIGTVLTDDPQLTVRLCNGASPQPIVLDSDCRMPATARLGQQAGKRCWVLTTRAAAPVPEQTGPELITVQQDADGRVNLPQALLALRSSNITSLMVEGGAKVISAFLRARLADALVVTVAPALVGGYKAVNELGFTTPQQLPRIAPLHTGRLGEDIIMWGNLQYGAQQP
jgi:riboflavin-specific deaminase-like protein